MHPVGSLVLDKGGASTAVDLIRRSGLFGLDGSCRVSVPAAFGALTQGYEIN